VASRQRAFAILTDRDLVTKLFKEISPLFKSRTSGYTRIIPVGFRRGDGATMAILELTERTIKEKLPKEKKVKAKVEAKGEAKAKVEAKKEEAPSAPEKKPAAPREEPKKHKATLQEEKKHEKAKSEEKKIADTRGFMKNIRGLFRKRGDR
jgi:large subunit ribosomal protein L17